MVIEHTICKIKKYRIMGDIFRNRLRKYDSVRYSSRSSKLYNNEPVFIETEYKIRKGWYRLFLIMQEIYYMELHNLLLIMVISLNIIPTMYQ